MYSNFQLMQHSELPTLTDFAKAFALVPLALPPVLIHWKLTSEAKAAGDKQTPHHHLSWCIMAQICLRCFNKTVLMARQKPLSLRRSACLLSLEGAGGSLAIW